MRKLAALIFCLLCAQGTVTAEQKQLVINSAAVDPVSGLVLVTGQQFGTMPAVTIDNMPVRVLSGSQEVLVVELPASLLAQPGTYLLTVERSQGANDRGQSANERGQGAKGSASFVLAVGAIGPQGPRGEAGSPGAKGDVGPAGPQGGAGPKGDKGDPGTAGAAGAKGDKGDKGDPGVAGAAGAKGDKGDPGMPGSNGLTGAKGDKGDRGDTGPAGQGSLRVFDANGTLVGNYVFAPDPAIILNIDGDWFRVALIGRVFATCSSSVTICITHEYLSNDCSGTPYMKAEDALAPLAQLIDGVIHYPVGEVATRDLSSIQMGSGSCMNVTGYGFQSQDAEERTVPLASLGLTGAFHLAR